MAEGAEGEEGTMGVYAFLNQGGERRRWLMYEGVVL